jgi:ectoine hydroxylase-related dioxygenase (phytanoyl-CoA dioxygenase family)
MWPAAAFNAFNDQEPGEARMTVVLTKSDVEAHVGRIRSDGYTIIENLLGPEQIAAVRTGLGPHLESYRGRNPFEGYRTERVYTLVARGKVFEDVAEDARLLAILDRFLRPGYLLTASQAINIHPGEAAQSMHYDDSFYPIPRPRPAISLTVVAAIDAFTAENGATMIIPGSQALSDAEIATSRSVTAMGAPSALAKTAVPAVMPAGAAIVFLGTLVHGGGANRSEAPRLAITNQYCEPWARTQENFFLGIPREQAKGFSPRLLQLLGYDVMPPFMGQVTGSHPLKSLGDGYIAPAARR